MQVSDLTVEELTDIIRRTVSETMKETVSETFQSLLIENDLVDPDLGKEIRPEFAAQLREAIHQTETGKSSLSAASVAEELGFNWNEL